MKQYDLVVIGSGPAGYVAAIRAGQLGFKTAIIEKDKTLGGTCLNVGCIPSKALLNSSEKYHEAKHDLAGHGISTSGVKMDVKKMIARKDEVVTKLTGGVAFLMKKNKVDVINGFGSLEGDGVVAVDGKPAVKAEHIIIAAGSTPIELPFAKYDHKVVIDSTDALSLDKVPGKMVVIGAGVIGLEMGSVWSRLGSEVTLVDIAERPVAVMDHDLGKEAEKLFKKQGLNFKMGAKVASVDVKGAKAKVKIEVGGKEEVLDADKVLVAVGRRAFTESLTLDKAGVAYDERGVIETGHHGQTNVKGVYAIGDCVKGPMLAHKGEEEGVECVERIAGIAGHVNYDCIPWVVYTEPEIAGVGKTEEEAKEGGRAVKVGKFAFRANGRALAVDAEDGFVKIIADKETDKVLGVHIIGKNASEMIAEAAVAMEFSASAEDIARSVHAHPTMSEATKEAALAVDGRALHS
ncbi:MAG: dihydrolipoyl dehydrogenase [Pseudomonadota bacterium]|nr:dihydrolipoyl dehydrogenase [Pseudomonadota bacterium]